MKNQEIIVKIRENNKVKYVCKICDYNTFRKSNIEKHFNTIKHKEQTEQKSSKKVAKSSKKVANKSTENEYFCEICNYKTKRSDNFERHCSGKPHHEKVREGEEKVRKSEEEMQEKNDYFCELCNYKTNDRANYNKHMSSFKHLKKTTRNYQKLPVKLPVKIINKPYFENENFFDTINKTLYNCEFCNKEYKYSSGLSKHKKKCKFMNIQQDIDNKLSILSQENETINKKLEELSNKPYTINNTLNIETFLNTECNGAIDFLDFIRNLTITTDDIKRMGKTGFIKSYGELVTQKIKDMDIKDRPAHCTNKRQMYFFIKHKDIWTDDKEHKLLNKSINILKDKECEAWYNYSMEEREKSYMSDADVNSRANAINEIAKMNDETLFTKIIKKASTELYLSKQDI